MRTKFFINSESVDLFNTEENFKKYFQSSVNKLLRHFYLDLILGRSYKEFDNVNKSFDILANDILNKK